MPQLAKGGKWVFGWVVVGKNCKISIPPEAYTEYGFREGETVLIIRGSRRSGGIGLGRVEKLIKTPLRSRFIGQTTIDDGWRVTLPPEAGILPGERLLVVRGSGLALSFLQCGPIYDEAIRHPEIEIFNVE
jgi:hypothetical protein